MKDLHREAAAKLFGVPESSVTEQQRQQAKRLHFLWAYAGCATRKLSEVCNDKRKG